MSVEKTQRGERSENRLLTDCTVTSCTLHQTGSCEEAVTPAAGCGISDRNAKKKGGSKSSKKYYK